MEELERAAELGAEHGKVAAEAWMTPDHDCGLCDGRLKFVGYDVVLNRHWHCIAGCAEEGNAHYSIDCCERPLPVPDLSGGTVGDWSQGDLRSLCDVPDEIPLDEHCDAYEAAFTAAVEAAVREAVR